MKKKKNRKVLRLSALYISGKRNFFLAKESSFFIHIKTVLLGSLIRLNLPDTPLSKKKHITYKPTFKVGYYTPALLYMQVT